jgi:hypothetical protein
MLPAGQPSHEPTPANNVARVGTDLLLLQDAVAALALLAARAALPAGIATQQALEQTEQALVMLRRTLIPNSDEQLRFVAGRPPAKQSLCTNDIGYFAQLATEACRSSSVRPSGQSTSRHPAQG